MLIDNSGFAEDKEINELKTLGTFLNLICCQRIVLLRKYFLYLILIIGENILYCGRSRFCTARLRIFGLRAIHRSC